MAHGVPTATSHCGVGIAAAAFQDQTSWKGWLDDEGTLMEASPSPLPESPDGLLPVGQETQLPRDAGITGREETEQRRVHVARFSVGEKTDTGSTQWAHYVRDNLHKRDQVEIAGYPKAREVKAKDGSTKTVHELYVGFLKFACLFLFWNSLHVDSCEVIFLLSPSMRLQGDNILSLSSLVDEQQKQKRRK
jgi:hypothetical protein